MRKTFLVALLVLAVSACQRELPPEVQPAETPAVADGTVENGSMREEALVPELLAGEDGPAASPSSLCNLDGVGESTFSSGPIAVNPVSPVLLHGWVGMDGATPESPESVLVRFSSLEGPSSWGVDAPVNGRREDVARARNAPGLRNSGLNVVLNLSSLPPGNYRVSLEYGTGPRYACDGSWVIEVRR